MDARNVPVYDAGNYDEVLASNVGSCGAVSFERAFIDFLFWVMMSRDQGSKPDAIVVGAGGRSEMSI